MYLPKLQNIFVQNTKCIYITVSAIELGYDDELLPTGLKNRISNNHLLVCVGLRLSKNVCPMSGFQTLEVFNVAPPLPTHHQLHCLRNGLEEAHSVQG